MTSIDWIMIMDHFLRHFPFIQALHEEQQQIAMEDEGDFEGECCEEEEEAEEEEDACDDVAVLDAETAVDFSSCCPGEEDMTPQGLATLKRLEACLSNGVSHSEVTYRRLLILNCEAGKSMPDIAVSTIFHKFF